MRVSLRAEVKASVIATMAEAEKIGRCPLAFAQAAYPGIPTMVLGECYADLQMAQEEAWWQRIERTIDAEMIQRAAITAAST